MAVAAAGAVAAVPREEELVEAVVVVQAVANRGVAVVAQAVA